MEFKELSELNITEGLGPALRFLVVFYTILLLCFSWSDMLIRFADTFLLLGWASSNPQVCWFSFCLAICDKHPSLRLFCQRVCFNMLMHWTGLLAVYRDINWAASWDQWQVQKGKRLLWEVCCLPLHTCFLFLIVIILTVFSSICCWFFSSLSLVSCIPVCPEAIR